MMEYKLSQSNLNLMEDCPRCFWLHMVKKIKRPTGPMSSIPIKMDSIIKHYFDRYRDIGQLPPMIDGKITGWLAVGMPKTLKYELENGIVLWGRPDDYFKLEKQQKMEKAVEIRDKGEKVSEEKKTSLGDNAIKVLNIRYAKGEITKEEYDQMKKDIMV